MSKCARCGRRKAKRACPALAAGICAACCGAARGRDLACPPDCRHLAGQASPGGRRAGALGPEPPANDPLTDERLAWLALHAESPLLELANRFPSFTDGDALRALESAREALGKGRALVILPGSVRRPEGELGEAVLRGMDACRWEHGLLVAGRISGYGTEEKIRVLDRLIDVARGAAGAGPGGRAYLELLADQFSRIRGTARRTKLITPA